VSSSALLSTSPDPTSSSSVVSNETIITTREIPSSSRCNDFFNTESYPGVHEGCSCLTTLSTNTGRGKKSYRCGCGKQFLRPEALASHQRKKHEDGEEVIVDSPVDESCLIAPLRLSSKTPPSQGPSQHYSHYGGKDYSRSDYLPFHHRIKRQNTNIHSEHNLFEGFNFGDREVMSFEEREAIPLILNDPKSTSVSHDAPSSLLPSPESSNELENLTTVSVLSPSTGVTSSPAASDIQDSTTSSEARTDNSEPHGLKRTRSQVSSSKSTGGESNMSLRTMGERAVSTLNRSLCHVQSVLSLTNSWRSSLVYSRSIASDRISATSEVHLTADEYASWGELVEGSIFDDVNLRLEYKGISLRDRPCCNFVPVGGFCEECGFHSMHRAARISDGSIGFEIDNAETDRFGNTVLHHAAAAGNVVRIKYLLQSPGLLNARNTSGETFLHVLNLTYMPPFLRVQEYEDILKQASKAAFDFSTRDYNRKTVAYKLRALTQDWDIDLIRQREIDHIIQSNENAIRGKRPNLPARLLGLGRINNDDLDKNGDTRLISTLKNWPQQNKFPRIDKLIMESEIHMRDRRGYTALAIATRYGLRSVAALLLEAGANPNTRSYQGTSIVSYGYQCLAQAQKEGKDGLYAKVMSCIVLLTDKGGKTKPNFHDEFDARKADRQPAKSAATTPTIPSRAEEGSGQTLPRNLQEAVLELFLSSGRRHSTPLPYHQMTECYTCDVYEHTPPHMACEPLTRPSRAHTFPTTLGYEHVEGDIRAIVPESSQGSIARPLDNSPIYLEPEGQRSNDNLLDGEEDIPFYYRDF
jgi:ankyrin repeat protein